MLSFIKIENRDWKLLVVAVLAVVMVFSFFYAYYAYGQELVTLTVNIQSNLTFTTSSDNFGNLTPGVYKLATTTLSVTTNNAPGWNVLLSGDDQTTANTVCDLDTDAAVGLVDQTEWVPGAATTTAGNGVVRASLDSTGDVLAFRTMTASGSTPFRSTAWWGASDTDGVALWAGIASSTAADTKVGNAGTGSYQAGAHLNTVQYYLDAPASQQTGAYSCPLTYTATAN